MSITKDQTLEVMNLAIGTIAELSEDKIKALLRKEAVFAVKYIKKEEKKIKSSDIKEFENMQKYIETLSNFNSREDAIAYLNSLKLNKEKLIILAKTLSVCISKGNRKEEIINKIVEFVVGSKLRVEAIRNGSL
jgi:hypothetical protein